MIWVSFFRPVGVFEGTFNKFAAWWTSGEYCHCEIVFEIEPAELMKQVKDVYNNSSKRLCTQLEHVFFGDKIKHIIHTKKKAFVSFSLLWGYDAEVRLLQESDDPFFSTPQQQYEDLTWIQCPNIAQENENECLNWALGEMTKPYNSSAALFSWVPSWEINSIDSRQSYFCSEFCSMALVRMGYLAPFATHHCTPNDLITLLQKKIVWASTSEDSSEDEEVQLQELINDIDD